MRVQALKVINLSVIMLSLSALVASPMLLPRPVPSAPAEAFTLLQERTPAPLAIQWNPATGIPDFLTGATVTARIPYQPTAAERGNPAAIARGFLDENRSLFRLKSVSDELTVLRVEPDLQLPYSHVRLQQVHQGIPVFGRQLIVHLDGHEAITAVNGHFLPNLALSTATTMTPAAAEALALEDLLESQLEPAERARVETTILSQKTQLIFYVDEHNQATLTWAVTIMTMSPLGQWRYFVHARRPLVVHRFDSVENGKFRRTFSAQNSTDIPGRLVVEEGERSRDAVAQAAHDGAGKVYDYYATTHRRDGIDGRGSPMVSTVHFGSDPQDAENAAWVGEAQQMIYGDGGRIFKPLPYGLDVVGHEFTHGIVESTAGLVYQGQSGALNESYADVFGALIDAGNWTVGEQVVKSPPFPLPYLRSLEDPNARGAYDQRDPLRGIGQPATMNQYANLPRSRRADNGGVHINSGIPNRAAFLVAQALGPQKMEQIYYRALTNYLTPTSTFIDAARASVQAATDLYGATDAEAVRNAFNQVGLDPVGGNSGPAAPSTSPTPGRTPAPPPASQALPAGCTNLANNPSFESEVGWTSVSTNRSAIIDDDNPHSGSKSAWLGGTDKEPLQYIYQDIAIPANATRVELGYWRFLHQETKGLFGLFASEARFGALIADQAGNIVGSVEKLASSQADDTWREARFDISQLAGKTIRLVFSAENPPNNVSSLFIDDVALVACTAGTGPAAPTTGAQNLVYLQGRITNADTGRGIEGAQVFILNPGVSATQAAADDSITANEVLTLGTTDSNGVYQTQAPVPFGQAYSIIVVARGFRPIVADNGITVPNGASNPFPVNATLRRSR